MRTLRQIRLVYRQHLLPPLIVPFQKITDYKKVIDREQNINSLEETLKLHKLNETVITQIIKIRNNFILPLQSCPFFYQFIDHAVRKKIKKNNNSDLTYSQHRKSMSTEEKLSIYRKFQYSHRQFMKNMRENSLFCENVHFVPIFPFASHEQMAISQKKDWNSLNEVEQFKMKEIYEQRLQKYWKKLDKIAENSSISTDQLLKLVKNQISPPLSTGLRRLLFQIDSNIRN